MITIKESRDPNTGQLRDGVNWRQEYETLLKCLHELLSLLMTNPKSVDVVRVLSGLLFEEYSYSDTKLPSLADWKLAVEKEAVEDYKNKVNCKLIMIEQLISELGEL